METIISILGVMALIAGLLLLGYFALKLAVKVLALAGAFIVFIFQALFESLISAVFPIQKDVDVNLKTDLSGRKKSKRGDGDDPQSYGATYLN